ncbi:rhodanese-like domain-containing protein [Sulfurimonas sp.]|uniref:rhodanese-like domain-containing protein n=1 Tax=Sulfurimonas sp. TaxID=2022749 RepID=UPI002626FA9E|nr:rhodanese-like domain-containing protein [Sulfurimonas sp.]MDD3855797.1 rhodanese-like domain-containing protein [Sulfurimonas sp.]
MRKLLIASLLTGVFLISLPLFAQDDAKMMLINEAKKEVCEITPKQLKAMFDDEKSVNILDVRESEQRAEGDIYDDMFTITSFLITRGNLEWEVLSKIQDKNAFIVTFCRNGGRGALAAQTLKKLGYKNAKNLQGGIADCVKAGYTIKTGLGITKLAKE